MRRKYKLQDQISSTHNSTRALHLLTPANQLHAIYSSEKAASSWPFPSRLARLPMGVEIRLDPPLQENKFPRSMICNKSAGTPSLAVRGPIAMRTARNSLGHGQPDAHFEEFVKDFSHLGKGREVTQISRSVKSIEAGL